MCGIQRVLCAGFGLGYVQPLVCAMRNLQSVLCVVFGLCNVQFAVTNLVACLRACVASFGNSLSF